MILSVSVASSDRGSCICFLGIHSTFRGYVKLRLVEAFCVVICCICGAWVVDGTWLPVTVTGRTHPISETSFAEPGAAFSITFQHSVVKFNTKLELDRSVFPRSHFSQSGKNQ